MFLKCHVEGKFGLQKDDFEMNFVDLRSIRMYIPLLQPNVLLIFLMIFVFKYF